MPGKQNKGFRGAGVNIDVCHRPRLFFAVWYYSKRPRLENFAVWYYSKRPRLEGILRELTHPIMKDFVNKTNESIIDNADELSCMRQSMRLKNLTLDSQQCSNPKFELCIYVYLYI